MVCLAACVIAGMAIGVVLALKLTKYRDRGWLRMRCHDCAVKLQRYFGNPVILMNMQHRAQELGHNYLTDKQFRKGLEETIRRAFGLGERP